MRSIILLHGAIGATDQLEPLAAELEKNFRVFMLGFSGHGRHAFSSKGFGIEIFAEELKSFITENKLAQPCIFGYSMGGYVALHLASIEPQLVGTIITLGTKFSWSPEIAEKEARMLDAETILQKVPKFAAALEQRHGSEWKELLQKTAQMMKGLGDKNILTQEILSKINSRVIIGLADSDNMVSLDETTAAYKNLPNAGMYMLPFTKHPIETVNASHLAGLIASVC